MRAIVTGCAGFIGSTLCDELLARGNDVVGVDCFTPNYDRARKERNLAAAVASPRFRLVTHDLAASDPDWLVDGADTIFHLAGEPGVRSSWSGQFADYLRNNVLATHRLLEATRRAGVPRFVFSSSASVYGNQPRYPVRENDLPRPYSPYGVTKLAAEHLCSLYADNWSVATVSLRYFSVYGPRQRPDMGVHRLIDAVLAGEEFRLHGDGSQVRDFTFVGDVVAATIAAADADCAPGTVLNVAASGGVAMRDVVSLVGELAGSTTTVTRAAEEAGDVQRTGGDATLAAELLGWSGTTAFRDGVRAQLEWHRRERAAEGPRSA